VKWKLLFVVLLFGFLSASHAADSAEPVAVDEICGRLVSVDPPGKGAGNSVKEAVKPFEHTRVRLFPPTAGADCCALMTPVAEVTTSRDGSFQFKKSVPGDYWLVATLGGIEYKLLIRYQPGKKGSADCSRYLYVLENGKFQFQRADSLVQVRTACLTGF
jgi:hypothetical protein